MSKSRILEREGESDRGRGEERVDSTVKEDGFQGGEEGLAISLHMRSRRRHERVIGRKGSLGVSGES